VLEIQKNEQKNIYSSHNFKNFKKKNCTIYRSEVPLFSMKHDHFFLFYPELRNRVYKKKPSKFSELQCLSATSPPKNFKKIFATSADYE
jgi:hypothetical protein